MSDLIERLNRVESSAPLYSGDMRPTTNWFRNPDGPEAAAEIFRLTAEVARLREALNEMLPRYCEMFSALMLGDPDIDSVAVQIARAALEATDD
jgi:hypothetical protein